MFEKATRPSSVFKTSVRFGLCTAAVVTTYVVLVETVLKPLHTGGWCQSVLDYLNGVERLLQAVALKGTYLVGFRHDRHLTWAEWLMVVAFTAAGFFAAGFVFRVLWHWACVPSRTMRATGETLPSRRRFLVRGMQVLAGGALAGVGYAMAVEPRRFEVTYRALRLRGLPLALDGLRVVQLTDLHHGPWVSLNYVRHIVQAANDLEPDLVFLTGDFVDHSSAYIRPVAKALAELRPRIGTVAVLGNHDWWEDGEQCKVEFARVGIPLIDNNRVVVTPDRRLVARAGEGLVLAGVGDLDEDVQDYERALGGLSLAMPRVLLSHQPDVAEEPALVQSRLRVDLIVSGHTHGGQVYVPFLGTPVTASCYSQKYMQGLVQGPVCPVFICRGLGVSGLPLRVGVRPELAVLEFRRV